MTCIGIDPAYAKPVTLAWRDRALDGLWVCRTADPRGEGFPEDLADIFAEFRSHGAERVCLEDGYVGRNLQVALRLGHNRGMIHGIALTQGLECYLVAPSRWQSDCLSSGGVRPHKHAQIALAAILRAKHVTGMDLGEDMACAVCLAEWGNAHPEVFGG